MWKSWWGKEEAKKFNGWTGATWRNTSCAIRRSPAFILWSTENLRSTGVTHPRCHLHSTLWPGRLQPLMQLPSSGLHPQEGDQGKWNQASSRLQRSQRHLQEVCSDQWRERCTLENKEPISHHLNSYAGNTFVSSECVSKTCLNRLDLNSNAVLVAVWCFILLFAISDKWGKYPDRATSHRVCDIQVLSSDGRMGAGGRSHEEPAPPQRRPRDMASSSS